MMYTIVGHIEVLDVQDADAEHSNIEMHAL
jgi:hypothetical protein